ncbi:MAG: hypothetical protein H0V89_06190, partial [Deltaproteobacteria bacterium]|nr:hypothetical protein [Deltaproteobacteria bacterium]
MWWLLVGCADEPSTCGPEECAAFAAAPPAVQGPLAPWEEALVGPLLADARGGIRPWDAEGIGICRGTRVCDAYLGTEVGELPPGDYLVRAELRVPELGPPGTWKIRYRSQCEVVTRTKDGGTRKKTETASLDQTVRYAGPEEGWRIEPLQPIHSPSEGASTCTWTLEGEQPSGPVSWSGSWSTPE